MVPCDQARLVSECQAALHAGGWHCAETIVGPPRETVWQVWAERAGQTIVCRAGTQLLAWIAALQQARRLTSGVLYR